MAKRRSLLAHEERDCEVEQDIAQESEAFWGFAVEESGEPLPVILDREPESLDNCLDLTYTSIAREEGVSCSRISQIAQESFSKIRVELGLHGKLGEKKLGKQRTMKQLEVAAVAGEESWAELEQRLDERLLYSRTMDRLQSVGASLDRCLGTGTKSRLLEALNRVCPPLVVIRAAAKTKEISDREIRDIKQAERRSKARSDAQIRRWAREQKSAEQAELYAEKLRVRRLEEEVQLEEWQRIVEERNWDRLKRAQAKYDSCPSKLRRTNLRMAKARCIVKPQPKDASA